MCCGQRRCQLCAEVWDAFQSKAHALLYMVTDSHWSHCVRTAVVLCVHLLLFSSLCISLLAHTEIIACECSFWGRVIISIDLKKKQKTNTNPGTIAPCVCVCVSILEHRLHSFHMTVLIKTKSSPSSDKRVSTLQQICLLNQCKRRWKWAFDNKRCWAPD